MDKAILFAVAASLCTATSSVCQRLGASRSQATKLDLLLVFRLARQPWRIRRMVVLPEYALRVLRSHS